MVPCRHGISLRGTRRACPTCTPTLYMSTLTTTRQHPAISDFHTCLYHQGKPRKVVIVVGMYKLLPVHNAVRRAGPVAVGTYNCDQRSC